MNERDKVNDKKISVICSYTENKFECDLLAKYYDLGFVAGIDAAIGAWQKIYNEYLKNHQIEMGKPSEPDDIQAHRYLSKLISATLGLKKGE